MKKMVGDRFSKMYLFNEETFRKMKERLAEEKKFNVLDKAMHNILGKRMASNQKWLLYRHELQKFLNLRRRMMGHDQGPPKSPVKKKNPFLIPLRKPKKYNISTDTTDLPQLISTKKNKDVQTEPNLRSFSTQTKFPIRFNQNTQAQPETNTMQTDTDDLPPPENFLTLSMLDDGEDDDTPLQRRLSVASTASRLIKTEPIDLDESSEINPTQIIEIFGNKYYIPLEDENDFRDYSIEFHKNHNEGDPIDIDDFYEWVAERRKQQAALEQPADPSALRLLHGPYRERVGEASTSDGRTRKRSHSRLNDSPLTGNMVQNTITSHFREKKRIVNQKGKNMFKWKSMK